MNETNSSYKPGSISEFLSKNVDTHDIPSEISRLFKKEYKVNKLNKSANESNSLKIQTPINLETKAKIRKKFAKVKKLDDDVEDDEDKTTLTNAERRIQRKPYLKEMKIQNQRTIFIGNVSLNSTKKDLENHFKSCGKIESVRLRSVPVASMNKPKKALVIKKDFHPKCKTLNAYIVFEDVDSVEEAVKLNNTELNGFHLRVDAAQSDKKHPHKTSIFIGNLRYDADEESLRKFFEECGEMDNIRIIRDKHTRVGKGFAYINFKDSSSVDVALTMNGQEFNKRPLRIDRSSSNPKPKNETRGSSNVGRQNVGKSFHRNSVKTKNTSDVKERGLKRKYEDQTTNSNNLKRSTKKFKNELESKKQSFVMKKNEIAKKSKKAKKVKQQSIRQNKKIKLGEFLTKK